MYRNRLSFVSKRLCIETSKPLKSVLDSTAHVYDAMHLGVDTTWQTGDAKERFSFIHTVIGVQIKEITLLL